MGRPQLQVGDVVVTSGSHSFGSRVIMWFTDSAWTHVFIVGENDALYESYFPIGVSKDSCAVRFAELERLGQAYRVLRVPELTEHQRAMLVRGALGQWGRKYDVLQAVLYGLFRVFVRDGPMRVICSRFITVAYEAASIDLFPAAVLDKRMGVLSRRYDQLRRGWCTPEDLIQFSALNEVS